MAQTVINITIQPSDGSNRYHLKHTCDGYLPLHPGATVVINKLTGECDHVKSLTYDATTRILSIRLGNQYPKNEEEAKVLVSELRESNWL